MLSDASSVFLLELFRFSGYEFCTFQVGLVFRVEPLQCFPMVVTKELLVLKALFESDAEWSCSFHEIVFYDYT